MNVPPIGISFTYPEGLPSFVAPEQTFQFQAQASPIGGVILQPNTGVLFYRVDGGAWNSTAMAMVSSPGLYEATLVDVPCASSIDFYVTAQTTTGGTFTGPPGAPASFHSTIAASGTESTTEDFELGSVGWTVVNHASLTAGGWTRVDPVAALNNTELAAPEDDAQAATDKIFCFVTGNGSPGGAASLTDVDGGPTQLISPVIDLADTDATISFAAWAYSSGGTVDSLIVAVSNDNGTNWTTAKTIGSTSSSWQTHSFQVGDFFPGVPLTSGVKVRFSASDNPNNSVTKAGVDVFQVTKFTCLAPCGTCSADVNADGVRSGTDIQDFLACLLGGGENCVCADLNSSGTTTDADVTLFVDSIIEGGACP